MSFFIFNGKNSKDFGIFERLPAMPTGTNTVTTFAVPGRVESLYIPEIEMADVTITGVLGLKDMSKRRNINAWLRGSGTLQFSDELDKEYRVNNVMIVHEYLSQRFSKVGISFVCSPLAYSVNNEAVEITENPSYLEVDGTYFAEPKYEITFKSGTTAQDFVFTVNGQSVTIKLTEEHIKHTIVLDARVQKIYYSDTKQLILPDTTGLVPYLNCGGYNSISWNTDTVEKIAITKNERWL